MNVKCHHEFSPFHDYTDIYIYFHMQICYFFYKNIAFGFSIWLYEAYTSFSAQSVYGDWFLSFYNVFFTALPVAALGIFEQDVSAASCLKVSHSLT